MPDDTGAGEGRTPADLLTPDETPDDETLEPSENGHDEAGRSMISPVEPPAVFDRLREQYESAREERREIFPIVPGRFGGNLAARYRPIDFHARRQKLRRLMAQGRVTDDRDLSYMAEIVSDACDAIMIRPTDNADWKPLHETYEPWAQGPPVRFDSRLCEVLGIDPVPKTAAEICRLVFANPEALVEHYALVDIWLKEGLDFSEAEDEGGAPERPT